MCSVGRLGGFTRARCKETGADVDVAAAQPINQQTDVMIHERRVFSAITDLILMGKRLNEMAKHPVARDI